MEGPDHRLVTSSQGENNEPFRDLRANQCEVTPVVAASLGDVPGAAPSGNVVKSST